VIGDGDAKSSYQRRLSEYLQCELYHLLGAYRVAGERLDRLTKPLAELEPEESAPGEPKTLRELVQIAKTHNYDLSEHRYASVPLSRFGASDMNPSADEAPRPARDPLPRELPLTKTRRFQLHPDSAERERKEPWPRHPALEQVSKYYRAAIEVLESYDPATVRGEPMPAEPGGNSSSTMSYFELNFVASLVAPRDGVSAGHRERSRRRHWDRRLARYRSRYQQAEQWLGAERLEAPLLDPGDCEYDRAFLERIATSNLRTPGVSLARFVVNCQAEAHLSMHAVEAWHLMCLGQRAEFLGEAQNDWLKVELERSIALSTFAYCASRTAPWMFAKDKSEWRAVFEDVPSAWENVVPTHCMWIASQMSLLALHRRAYARALKNDAEGSYNDYHKLHQLIRDTERRVESAPIRVDGAQEFLEGMSAEAHHHIGELYRSHHAHKPALEHFEAASHRLARMGDREIAKPVLVDSRWSVELRISRGKACYEMGMHKEALTWYLHAWRAFLELLAEDSQTEASTEKIEEAIAWLEDVKFEPELRKEEVSERLRPVVDQLDRISAVGPLGALAAEILLRLGHLLFVLNVAYDKRIKSIEDSEGQRQAQGGEKAAPKDESHARARERIMRTLAQPCMAKAAECDPHSTLVGADLLKARFRFDGLFEGSLPPHYSSQLELPELRPVGQHWPHGGDDYERLARVAEYLILDARVDRFEEPEGEKDPDPAETDALLARDLLLSLFMSTDSINVRKSQIHRFLMQPPKERPVPGDHEAPAIEFVCMRRYSSPFPLLPRPSAFRSLGGGYFVRLHGRLAGDQSGERKPYGIVVDPGVDFVENLYRAGYSLSDVDMIFVTHDHVDHLGGLDPLLSLLHVRAQLLKHERKAGDESVKVLVSKSVALRYDDVKLLRDSERFQFECFEPMKDSKGVLRKPPLSKEGKRDKGALEKLFEKFPEEFEIVAMSSEAGAPEPGDAPGEAPPPPGGHRDLSDLPSHGVCIRTRDPGPSLAITSDTPPPPRKATDPKRYRRWRKAWDPALESDMLVVHLSSVPLTELRRMDRAAEEGLAPPSSSRATARATSLPRDEKDLEDFQVRLQKADDKLQGQIEYAQWLRSHNPDPESGKLTAPLVGPVPPTWLPPADHNYLAGLLSWAREYEAARERMVRAKAPKGPPAPDLAPPADGIRPLGLFVIGELSEELGTMRGKVATKLSSRVFEGDRRRRVFEGLRGDDLKGKIGVFGALSADIGLHVCVTADGDAPQWTGSKTEVLCTTCDLDTDRAPEERFHYIHNVFEVCVKGENEGIFYNCLEHDPTRQEDPTFLERLERFDIFGR
jgi:tetratricopeptide (TPR) repeat protein